MKRIRQIIVALLGLFMLGCSIRCTRIYGTANG